MESCTTNGDSNASGRSQADPCRRQTKDRGSSKEEDRERKGEEGNEHPFYRDQITKNIQDSSDPSRLAKFAERLEEIVASAIEAETTSKFVRSIATLSRNAHALTDAVITNESVAGSHVTNLIRYRKDLLAKLKTFPDLPRTQREYILGVLRCVDLHGPFIENVRKKSEKK